MKKKIKISICGEDWELIFDDNKRGGCFNSSKKRIVVGNKNIQEKKTIFLHEIIEAVITNRGHRWIQYDDTNDSLLINMNHHEFENVVQDISYALKDHINI
jgi:hypothetical protein